MAATSYTTLPSSTYVALGSQGDLFHSANYGTYDSGIGSITSHPYQYQTTSFGTHLPDSQQQSSYSNDYLQSSYSTHQPQHYSTDKYAPQSTYNQDSLLNDYPNSHIERSTLPNNIDGNSQPPHQTSYGGTTQHHLPASTDNQYYQPQPKQQQHHQSQPNNIRSEYDASNHSPPKQQQHHQSEPNNIRSEHAASNHPLSKQQQHHQSQLPSHSNQIRSEHDASNHPPPKQQQYHQSQPPSQSSHVRSEQDASNRPPPKQQQQHHQSQSNLVRSEHPISNPPPKQPPPVRHRSPSNGYASETTIKTTNPPPETKSTKSTKMRAAAIKEKEVTREQKQKDGNFPSTKKKSTKSQPDPVHRPRSEDEQSNKEKTKRTKKQSHSVPKPHKSRREDYQTDDNNSSNDEDTHHTRSKSNKRTAYSDSHYEKYPLLPPIRHGRGPPGYDPAYDYPFPSGHPLRGRYPYYDDHPFHPYAGRYDHRHRHLYEDAYNVPPYIAPYHDPYDGFFDYEKRKTKSKLTKPKDKKEPITDHEDHGGITGNETEHDEESKSPQSKTPKTSKTNNDTEHPHYHEQPYYDEGDMLEMWRQERNDYLKKKFKPSIHDVLYSQQWMKSDSYVENQRRRALRDSQGYYFPYKKYTLKDYKDLQKSEAKHNPYASISETTLNRKERAKKRHDYASHMERQGGDFPGEQQQKTPRDMPPRKPWHLSNGEANNADKLSKRDRALEYAKVQVIKHRPLKAPKNQSGGSDPTERYVDSLFPHDNDDGEGSANERNNQSDDDDDDQ